MPLAARSDQLAHRQQFEHFEPRHLRLAVGQTLAPKRVQFQFIPQTASQPAIAENPRALQRQLRKLDSQPVENLRRNVPVFGKETNLFGRLIGFVDHLQALAPGRLLRVVDLAQIKDGALRGVPRAQTPVFDHAPVAMLLAVLVAGVVAQKHSVGGQSITSAQGCGRGLVSTCGIWRTRALVFNDLRQARAEKKSK